MASEVEKRFILKKDQLLELDHLLPEKWPELKAFYAGVRPPQFYLDLFRRTGYPLTLDSLNLAEDEYIKAVLTARTIRERITVLDLAAHAEVLEPSAREVLELLK